MNRALGLGNDRVVITAEEHAQEPFEDVVRIRKSRLVELIKKSRQVGLFKWDELCLKFRIHISTK